MLVVIAILAILAAMLLPALSKVKDIGKRTLCMSNLHQVSTVLFSYASDYNEQGPHELDGQMGRGLGVLNTLAPDGMQQVRCPDFGPRHEQSYGKRHSFWHSSWCCIFGTASWQINNETRQWFGFNLNVVRTDLSNAAPIPSLNLLGRKAVCKTSSWTFPSPARQPICGDSAPKHNNDFIPDIFYLREGEAQITLHGAMRNAVFADGHSASGPTKDMALKHRVYIYTCMFLDPEP